VAVLAIGSLSALIGVLYALMQTDLKRLLAYSSVENVGIVFIALGLSLLFQATGHASGGAGADRRALSRAQPRVVQVAAVPRRGAILHSTHERDLDQMGGLLRRMPWTGPVLPVGCISIAALPPFNGFVSEWLTFQSALQAWRSRAACCAVWCRSPPRCWRSPARWCRRLLRQGLRRRLSGAGPLASCAARPALPKGMRAGSGTAGRAVLLLGVLPTQMVGLLDPVAEQMLGHGCSAAGSGGWLWLTPISSPIRRATARP
jgi:hydrogenase-4 component B